MNPLFNSLFGQKQGQIPSPQMRMTNPSQPDMNALMSQLQANPAEAIRSVGYNVPDELNGNAEAMVQHLLRTGQIGGPMMQRIAPYLPRR